MARINYQQALEQIFADRLTRYEGYVEVPTSFFVEQVDIRMSQLPALALYYFKSGKPELLKAADQQFSPLALSVHETIWVREQDYPAIRSQADQTLLQTSNSPKASTQEQKLETLRRSAIQITEDLFNDPSPENIKKSTKVVSTFIYVLMRDPKAYLHLSQLSSHDPYTLQHSVGAAINSIILGRKIGIRDEQELMDLGIGGLLHDIGKVKVKKEIINKPGPLDPHEWDEMRQHSSEGFGIVKDNTGIGDKAKVAILEHHEDKLGTGYPSGKRYSDVHVFSKIVCLGDIFNALTTNRSYSKALSPFDAFQLIKEKMMNKVDEELFRHLVQIYGGKFDD